MQSGCNDGLKEILITAALYCISEGLGRPAAFAWGIWGLRSCWPVWRRGDRSSLK